MTERIGVLLVHGIGMQLPNQHLIGEARNIVAALGDEAAAIEVVTEPSIPAEVPKKFTTDFSTNKICVDVTTTSKRHRRFRIEFNEVYWADLGEAPTLPRQVKFWFWALSMWTVAGREYTRLVGFKDMYVPRDGRFKYLGRFVLGFYGALFFLGAATVGLLNLILERLKLPRVPISDLLTAYVGDVMLYSQPARDQNPIVSELGEPPRVAIRARMVDAMVEFAMRDYDHWFILAHSLGSVVAYNGLMETEAALPNYLTEGRWQQVKALLGATVEPVIDVMLPRRPVWLSPTDGIDRRILFSKLRGLLTYGSAIGKLRAIWPVIVPANRDEYVFREDFEWFNIYEPTDPVSGRLAAFLSTGGRWDGNDQNVNAPLVVDGRSAAKITQSIAYKAGPIWLLSHLGYLTRPSPGFERPKHPLVFKVASWLIRKDFGAADLQQVAPAVWLRSTLRTAEVLLIGLAVWLGTAALLWYILPHKWLAALQWRDLPAIAVSAIAVAALLNAVGWAADRNDRGDPPRWLRWTTIVVGGALICLVSPWAAAAVRCVRDSSLGIGLWLAVKCPAIGFLVDLLNHPGAARMAIGLLSLTLILIVALGALRWLFQPLPVQPKEHMRGVST
ncbi:hypothetical protein [Reyranella soli]|uniref:Uncharacterized protein n=1 Tax=Reyranella soli TaxID=1230389 RepID=A0A512NQQ3_9HYPH|nr:hypothetical protein [Reyranella soli]GEP61284.1 hypothetical protein RSO01_84500 [Reyranella soli]